MKYTHLKKIQWIALLVTACIFLGGCFDTKYMAEREYWHADQNMRRIAAEKQGNLNPADFEALIQGYRKVTEIAPLEILSAKCQMIITKLYLRQGKNELARKELIKIIQNFSADQKIAPQAQFLIAKIYESEGKFDLALEEFEKVMDIYPMSRAGLDTPLYLAKADMAGNAIQSNRNIRKAIRHYETLVEEWSPETTVGAQLSKYLGDTYIEAQEYDKALGVWESVLEKNPDTPVAIQASFYKAQIFATHKKNVPEAIKIFESMMDQKMNEPLKQEMQFRLAYLYLENQQFDKSLKSFSELIESNPEESRIGLLSQFGKANVYQKTKQPKLAIKEYKAAQKKYSSDTRVIHVPFLIYYTLKTHGPIADADLALTSAITTYKILFDTNKPSTASFKAGRLLFLCHTEKANWKAALATMDKLIELAPKDPRLLASKAQIYLHKLNDKEKAAEVFVIMKNRFPKQKNLVAFAATQIESLTSEATDINTEPAEKAKASFADELDDGTNFDTTPVLGEPEPEKGTKP